MSRSVPGERRRRYVHGFRLFGIDLGRRWTTMIELVLDRVKRQMQHRQKAGVAEKAILCRSELFQMCEPEDGAN